MANPPTLSNVKLLLHCNGADTSTTFTDSSPSAKTVTANGNAQIDTAQSKFGGASGLFDGSGDYLTVPDSADWYFAADFTVECWVRFNTMSQTAALVGQWDPTLVGNASWVLQVSPSSVDFVFYDNPVGNLNNVTGAFTPATNTWYHVAADRAGNVFRVYVDGVVKATATLSRTFWDSANPLSIGRLQHTTTEYLNGWIDDVRVVKGEAVYAGAFTPPSAALPDSVSTARPQVFVAT